MTIPFNDLPRTLPTLVPSQVPNNAVPGIKLIQPFTDPTNTFRASTVNQMYFLVPSLPTSSSLEYDVGVTSSFKSTIYSIQNNAVSHSLYLEIHLPPYLVCNTLLTSSIPPRTIANVTVNFNNSYAQILTTNTEYNNNFYFVVKPLNVFGPVFIDKSAVPPPDLNLVSSSVLPLTPVTSSQIVYVDRPVYISLPSTASAQLMWKNGVTGEIEPGSPPAGWIIEADGAAYPPVSPADTCGGDGNGTTDIQMLMDEVAKVPLFKPASHRSALTLLTSDITSFIVNDPTAVVLNNDIANWIIDLGPEPADVKIQNYSKKTFGGSNVSPTDEATALYINVTEVVMSRIRGSQTSIQSYNNIYELLIELVIQEILYMFAVKGKMAFNSIEEVGSFIPSISVAIDNVANLTKLYQHTYNSSTPDIQMAYKGLQYRVMSSAAALLTFAKKANI